MPVNDLSGFIIIWFYFCRFKYLTNITFLFEIQQGNFKIIIRLNNNISERIISRLGYKSDQQGIWVRYMREQENWRQHLNNTRQCIINEIRNQQPETVYVLGSGWLLDVPVDYLLLHCKKINLVDICHPKSIQRKYKDHKNIEFIQYDLSGYITAVHALFSPMFVKNRMERLLLSKPVIPPEFNGAMVVSLNLLDQLDTLLIDYISRKKIIQKHKLLSFRKKIQEHHINSLKLHNNLIVYTHTEINKPGNVNGKTKVHVGFHEQLLNQWNWFFDTEGKYENAYQTVFQVRASKIINQ